MIADVALAIVDEAANLPGTSRMSLGPARVLAAEVRRLRSQNARLTSRLRDAGLLGEPVEAENGDEQRAPGRRLGGRVPR